MTSVGETASSEEVGSAAVENTSPTFSVTDLLLSSEDAEAASEDEPAEDEPAGLTSPEEAGEEPELGPSLGMDMAAAVSEIMNKLEGGANGGTESPLPPMLPPAKVAESLLAPGPEIVVISTPAAVPQAENQAADALSPNTAAPLAVNSGLSPEDVAAAWILQQIAAASSSPSGAAEETASTEPGEPPSQSNFAAMENKEADLTAPVTESFAGERTDVAPSGEVGAAQPMDAIAASTSSPGQPEAAAGEPITPSSVQLVSDQIIVDGAAVASSPESGMVVDGAAVASAAGSDMVSPVESISSASPVEPASNASIDSLLSVPTEATISPTLDPSITVPALSLSSVPGELASDSTAKVPEDVALGAPDPVAPIISAPETSVTSETLAVPEVPTPDTSSKSPEVQLFSGAPEVAPEVNTSSNASENNSSSVAPEVSSSSGTAEVSSSSVEPEMSSVSDAPEVGSSTGAGLPDTTAAAGASSSTGAPEVGSSTGAPPDTTAAAGASTSTGAPEVGSSTGAPPETVGAAGTNSSTSAPPETVSAAGTNSSTSAPPETAGAAGTNSSTGAPPETAGAAGTNSSTGAPVSDLGPSGILPLTSGTLGS